MAEDHSYGNRLWQLWRVLSSQPYQSKLRSKSPNLHPAPARQGEFIIVAGESQIVKPGDHPNGIVFRDESFLIVYERWSKETDSLLRYKYHYQRPDGWFVRYDMHETELPRHPKHHLQASALGEDVLEMIVEQFVA